MIDTATPGYMQELPDLGWVQEVIMETFDGALELLGPHDAVYGGAVRDCLAGMELVGDLDIAVSASDFKRLSDRFINSTRWAPKSGNGGILPPGFGTTKKKWFPKFGKGGNSGDIARTNAPMTGVTAFRGMSGREAQIITSKQRTKDHFQDALHMARMVDIVCCGVVMLADGRVFEVVPGAYQDCKDRILRLNDGSDTMYIDALPHRIEKLEKRGWQNTINVDKAIRDVKLAQDKAKKLAERRRQSMRRKSKSISIESHKPMFGDVVKEYRIVRDRGEEFPDDGGTTTEVKKAIVSNVFNNNLEEITGKFTEIAHKLGINIRLKFAPLGNVYYTVTDYERKRRVARALHELEMQHKMLKAPAMPKKKRPTSAGVLTGRINSGAKWASVARAEKSEHTARLAKKYGYVAEEVETSGPSSSRPFEPFKAKPAKMATETVVLRSSEEGAVTEARIDLPKSEAREVKLAWSSLDDEQRVRMMKDIASNAERIETDE